MTASIRPGSPPLPDAVRASKLMVRASVSALRCMEAIQLADRGAAVTHLADLREASSELQHFEHGLYDEVARLAWQESKLARTIMAMTVSSEPVDDSG